MHKVPRLMSLVQGFLTLALVLVLQACASSDKPTPTALEANPSQLGVKELWRATVGATALPLEVRAVGTQVLLASTQGEISAMDARSGKQLWRASVGAPLSAGVGSDGEEEVHEDVEAEMDAFLAEMEERQHGWPRKSIAWAEDIAADK